MIQNKNQTNIISLFDDDFWFNLIPYHIYNIEKHDELLRLELIIFPTSKMYDILKQLSLFIRFWSRLFDLFWQDGKTYISSYRDMFNLYMKYICANIYILSNNLNNIQFVFFLQNHTPVAASAVASSNYADMYAISVNFADEDSTYIIILLKIK